MAAGDPHPDAIAAADDGPGTAAAARAGLQPSRQAVEGDGNQLLNQVSAGRDLTLGDSFAIVVADPQQAAVVTRSLRWSWPQPLVFSNYRTFRREGFGAAPGCSRRCAPGRWRMAPRRGVLGPS
jgi:hypothetical protein